MPELVPTRISQLPNAANVEGSDRIPVDRLGAAVAAGEFVIGQAYQIVTAGTTNFLTFGAANNNVGTYFVASGAGSGTGTAAPINTLDAPMSAVAEFALAAHEAAADPHPNYLTAGETAAAVAAAIRTVSTQTLTYAAIINLDLAALTGTHQLLTLAGSVEFTVSNLGSGRWVTIFIDPGASDRTLTFPVAGAAWVFYSLKPAMQTANKRAVLALKANGTASSDIAAIWREAP